MIPKIIHKLWFSIGNGAQVPEKYNSNVQSWKMNHTENEGWRHVLWNEEMALELLRNHYPWFVNYFQSYKSAIYKIDSIRYFILHHYGGVYVDQDVVCHKSIRPLVEKYNVFLVPTPNSHLLKTPSNFVMASVSGHPFFKYVIEKLPLIHQSWFHWKDSLSATMFMAGPGLLTVSLLEYNWTENSKTYPVTVLPLESFTCESGLIKNSKLRGLISGNSISRDSNSGNFFEGEIEDTCYGHHQFAKSYGVNKKILYDVFRALFVIVIVLLLVFAFNKLRCNFSIIRKQ